QVDLLELLEGLRAGAAVPGELVQREVLFEAVEAIGADRPPHLRVRHEQAWRVPALLAAGLVLLVAGQRGKLRAGPERQRGRVRDAVGAGALERQTEARAGRVTVDGLEPRAHVARPAVRPRGRRVGERVRDLAVPAERVDAALVGAPEQLAGAPPVEAGVLLDPVADPAARGAVEQVGA